MRLGLALFLAGIAATSTVQAAGTAAGTDITNTASATFTDPGGVPQAVNSNTSTLRVDEILDVTLDSNDAGNVAATTPDSNRVLSFTLTNTGNGSETFALTTVSNLGGDSFDPGNVRIYLDNGDNVFNILTDTLLVPGSNDPTLAEDTSLRVFVVSDIPAGLGNSNTGLVRLEAEAVTAQATAGDDAPGSNFAGQGSNGSDAVVGSTQADANGQNGYIISQVATSFDKTSSVLDQFGGSNPIPGATITYTLTFSVSGAGNLTGTQIVDPIPTGTSYVPGSLTLDGGAISDTSDADAGRFTGTRIEIGLGTVTAPATHTVTFKVTIN